MFGRSIKKYKYLIATIIILLISVKINLIKQQITLKPNINRAIQESAEIYHNNPDQTRSQMIGSVVRLSYFSSMMSIMNSGESNLDKISTATGFSIGYDKESHVSFVITNDHFCERIIIDPTSLLMAEKSNVARVSTNQASGIISEVIYTSPEYDLCLLEVFGRIDGAILAQDGYRPEQFEKIFIIGAPSGNLPIIVETFYSADIPREQISMGSMTNTGDPFLMTSEMVFPGHSGSPIFNQDGQVIGVIFASFSTYGGIGIPVKDIYTFIEEASNLNTGQ